MWLNLPWVRLEGMVQPSAGGFGGGGGAAFHKWGSRTWCGLPQVGLRGLAQPSAGGVGDLVQLSSGPSANVIRVSRKSLL